MALTKDLDEKEKNIDRAIDMLLAVQKENGVESGMQKALFDPTTNARINKFLRARLEQDGVDLKPYGVETCGGCKGCQKKELSNIKRGVFVFDEEDLYDDEESEEPYVCEYCNKIGYDNAYKPELCDICDDCADCREYVAGECDGCGYSRTYNGTSYGLTTEQTVVDTMNPEDSKIYNELDEQIPDEVIHRPSRKFSIMDY
ncbi:MAG: hypothetical protein NC548_41305 [Lachnospiraceae bacterium]|nr:hypothetical protein [Lachnospiraceae bacterium]